ncbi:MAG: hypothetical protein L6V91_06775 [Bacilli bacterium]|nr:MAG: hypothetical protein L6V91_06775 [Bacilli bacterium]
MNIIELYDCKDTTMEQKDYKKFRITCITSFFDYQDIYNSFCKKHYMLTDIKLTIVII